MITKIKKLVNPEFASKHAGSKPLLQVGKIVCQIVSGLTAFYALKVMGWFGGGWLNYIISFGIALVPELIILAVGWGAMLPIVEYLTGMIGYKVESETINADKWGNGLNITLFFIAFSVTTFLTWNGSFEYGYNKNDPGEPPSKTAIFEQKKNELKAEYDLRNKVNLDNQTRINTSLESERLAYEKNKAEAEQILSTGQGSKEAIRKAKDWKTGRPWYNQRPGEELALKRIKDLEIQLSKSQLASTLIFAERDQKAEKSATMVYNELMGKFDNADNSAKKSGNRIFWISIVAQVLVFFILYYIVLIDVGTGRLPERKFHVLDGVTVLFDRTKVHYYRFLSKFAYGTYSLSNKQLQIINGRGRKKKIKAVISPKNESMFQPFFLTEDYVLNRPDHEKPIPIQHHSQYLDHNGHSANGMVDLANKQLNQDYVPDGLNKYDVNVKQAAESDESIREMIDGTGGTTEGDNKDNFNPVINDNLLGNETDNRTHNNYDFSQNSYTQQDNTTIPQQQDINVLEKATTEVQQSVDNRKKKKAQQPEKKVQQQGTTLGSEQIDNQSIYKPNVVVSENAQGKVVVLIKYGGNKWNLQQLGRNISANKSRAKSFDKKGEAQQAKSYWKRVEELTLLRKEVKVKIAEFKKANNT